MNFEITKCCNEANQDLCEQGVLLSPENLGEELKPIDISKPYSMDGGVAIANFVDADGKRKIIAAPQGHTLLVGSTGSGKTEAFYLPQIELLGKSKDNVSFVVMDMKGNMYRQKSQMLKDNGFEVVVLNGKNPFASSKYNPLTVIFRAYRRAKDAEKQFMKVNPKKLEFMGKRYDDYLDLRFDAEQYININMAYCHQMIDKVVEIIVPIEGTRDPSWDYGAREMVKALMYLLLEDSDIEKNPLTESQFTLYNVAKLLDCRSDDCMSLISYVQKHKATSPGRSLLNYIDSRAKQTRDSYLMDATDKLNRVVNIPMNAMSICSDIDLDELVKDLGTKRTAIFLIADSSHKSIYTLCNLFLIQLIVALQKHGDDNPKGDFHIFADEFCNMVPMPDIIDWITTMRSRRTWFHLGIQSYSQLEHHYSEQIRHTIEGNSKTIFMGSNDYLTLDSFSRSAGLTMKVANSYNIDNGGNLSLSLSSTNVPLVRVSDLANMKLGEAYVKIFGSSGNKIIKTVLDPDFAIDEFAHGHAEPEVIKRHTVTAEENLYDYKSNRNVKVRRWDDFFSDDQLRTFDDNPKSRLPVITKTPSDDFNMQIKIKGIIAKLAEKEKAFLKVAFENRNYEEVNKYLLDCKEIAGYGPRFREFGILAYSVTSRLALNNDEYELLKKQLCGEKRTEFDKAFGLASEMKSKTTERDDNVILNSISASMLHTSLKEQMPLQASKNNIYNLQLPFGNDKIKIIIDKVNGKISDDGETFVCADNKDRISKELYSQAIDSLITSFGLIKRTKDGKVQLEKKIADDKSLLQDILSMYNVICMIKRIGALSVAFPHGGQ